MSLYIAHQSEKILKCAFYSVVIKNQSISDLYPEGLNGFIQKHRCRCNNDISVECAMGVEIDNVVEDLYENGLEFPRDFLFFDAGW